MSTLTGIAVTKNPPWPEILLKTTDKHDQENLALLLLLYDVYPILLIPKSLVFLR
jgi:hypothetical protein